MKAFPFIFLLISLTGYAGTEGMPNMPTIKAKQTHVVKTTEDGETLRDERGFGDKEPEVKMMNLMMVEGSGYAGMDMSNGMKMAANDKSAPVMDMSGAEKKTGTMEMDEKTTSYDVKQSPTTKPPKTGVNALEFSVNDKQGKPVKGLKIKSEVKMLSMDMGTENPRVKEVSPGKYQVKVSFSMQGPWGVTLIFPNGEQHTFDFNAGK